ncbi:MAG TPA: MBL fold metallo-hydrolase [Gemmatimonadaceae bacterium]|jgi:hydroxyacylglutathione hydrolase|nr:MBL fold metallo-hydrolase [Gemmatimonadaceae bacterium]
MIFRRLYHEGLAQASYLIACEATRQAVVVDPLRDPGIYRRAAARDDVRIAYVTETHLHADFLSGAEALATDAGAALLLSAAARDDATAARLRRTRARPLHDGDVVQVGRVRLEARHTPGHTPEHLIFVVTDEAIGELPVGLLSGDFLFAGDVGRPDLLERAVGVKGSMHAAAAELFHALQAMRSLPEYLQVWPGHGAGSACGKSLGAVPQTTLGYEIRTNWAFQVHDEATFVGQVLADQPEPPAYFATMKRLNAAGVPPMPAQPHGDAESLRRAIARGARVVDARTPAAFLAGHLEGAILVPLGRSFVSWAGSVLDPTEESVLVLAPEDVPLAAGAIHDLALIGFDRVLGAISAAALLPDPPRAIARLRTMPAAKIGEEQGATVLDVRAESEWSDGHIPGALNIPLARLPGRIAELRESGPIVVHCQGGARSAIAASVLQAAGFAEVVNAEGGYDAWARAHRAVGAGERSR